MPPWLRNRCEEERGIGVTVVVGYEDSWAIDGVEAVGSLSLG
jgi:hypothetical protein